MSMHNKIMNLPIGEGRKSIAREALTDSGGVHIAYKIGHRDARHAAAELSIEADELMAEMAEALKYYESAIDDDSPASWALIKYNAYKEQTK